MDDLLILDQDRLTELYGILAGHRLRVVQEVSPRVVLVEGAAADLTAMAGETGVLSATARLADRGEPALGALSLTRTEDLFVKAWIQRQSSAEKSRPGDGLDWDSNGFSAP